MFDLDKKLQSEDEEFAAYEEIAEEGNEEALEETADEEAPADKASADEAPADEAPAAEEEIVTFAEEEEDLDSEDSLTFSNGVIEKIVAIAMRSVPGVVGMSGGWFDRLQDAFGRETRKGVSVEVTPDSSVRVNVSVLIEYGAYAPQVFEDVKKCIIGQVTGMTGLPIAGVNLRIVDVLTPEEIAARNAEVAPASKPEEASFEEPAAEDEATDEAAPEEE
jgi:uncharacterized alkaline shock family protein YloU